MEAYNSFKAIPVFTPLQNESFYEGWNFNCGNYLFTTDTK